MNARHALIAGGVALLTACGSATDAITFTAPAAFHAKASIGPFMQMWESTPRNVIILMSLPTALDLDKAMDQADLKGAHVQKTERIKICGSQPAIFALVQGETNTGSDAGRPSDVEFLATNVKGKTYMAMYARPLHAAADHAAEAAIRNICPK